MGRARRTEECDLVSAIIVDIDEMPSHPRTESDASRPHSEQVTVIRSRRAGTMF
jgi:hypothetical protein